MSRYKNIINPSILLEPPGLTEGPLYIEGKSARKTRKQLLLAYYTNATHSLEQGDRRFINSSFFPEMTFFAFLFFSPILLIGVDGHGALVWPPNWTDGQPIPLDQRLNSPNFCCSLKFWTLSSKHRCPLNCLSIFKGCFHN